MAELNSWTVFGRSIQNLYYKLWGSSNCRVRSSNWIVELNLEISFTFPVCEEDDCATIFTQFIAKIQSRCQSDSNKLLIKKDPPIQKKSKLYVDLARRADKPNCVVCRGLRIPHLQIYGIHLWHCHTQTATSFRFDSNILLNLLNSQSSSFLATRWDLSPDAYSKRNSPDDNAKFFEFEFQCSF